MRETKRLLSLRKRNVTGAREMRVPVLFCPQFSLFYSFRFRSQGEQTIVTDLTFLFKGERLYKIQLQCSVLVDGCGGPC
ncbi:hypothetical protein HMPREF9374_3067 [Desmospora sp. 8437]|nr:hypothetical protein HMPREF9374_3067 [Desmospora sp. 8437]